MSGQQRSENLKKHNGPFLVDLKNPRSLNPYWFLAIGIICSTIVIIYHFVGFREHIQQAERGLNEHLEQLRFAEEFSAIDEALSIAAREAMQGHDRQILARYLEQENRMQELFDRRNRIIIAGLTLFWAFFAVCIYWLRKNYSTVCEVTQNQRQELEALVESMPHGVVAINKGGEFTLWNRAARELMPAGPNAFPTLVWDRVTNVRKRVYEFEYGEKIFRCSGSLIKSSNQESKGAMLIFEDVTEQKMMEKELDIQRQRQAHASKMATLGEVSGHLAHEINTPLSTVQISLDGIDKSLSENNHKSLRTYLHCIAQAVKRMSNIVEAFRRYSYSDGFNEADEYIDLRQVLNDALEICGPDLRARGINLQKDLPPKPIWAKCKPGSLSQTVINLMTNARDAVGEIPKGWVKLSLKDQQGWVTIDVEDAGKEIDTQTKKKIFEPFFTTKGRGKGNGIGLGIVKDVARAHGGDVIYDVRDGHSCFEIKFPRVSLPKRAA